MLSDPHVRFAERFQEVTAAEENQTGLGSIDRLDELVVVTKDESGTGESRLFRLPSLEPNPVVLVLQSQPDHLDPMLRFNEVLLHVAIATGRNNTSEHFVLASSVQVVSGKF